MVSPSGMSGRSARFLLDFFFVGLSWGHGGSDAAHVESQGGINEAGVFEEASKEMILGRLIVDGGNEQALLATLAADREIGQARRDLAGELSAFGFVLRKENPDRGIAATEVRGKLS